LWLSSAVWWLELQFTALGSTAETGESLNVKNVKSDGLQKSAADKRGYVWIQGVVANASNSELRENVSFLVDTGAGITVIPEEVAKKLKLRRMGEVNMVLADGSIVKAWLSYVYLYIAEEGILTLVTVCTDEALLGVDILGLLNLQVDLARKKLLKPVKTLKIKKMVLWRNPVEQPSKENLDKNRESL